MTLNARQYTIWLNFLTLPLTFFDLVQESHVPILHVLSSLRDVSQHLVIPHVRQALGQSSQFVEMRCKETKASDLGCDMSEVDGSRYEVMDTSCVARRNAYSLIAQARPNPS